MSSVGIEYSPSSRAGCRDPLCEDTHIQKGELRMLVRKPKVFGRGKQRRAVDVKEYYHFDCFFRINSRADQLQLQDISGWRCLQQDDLKRLSLAMENNTNKRGCNKKNPKTQIKMNLQSGSEYEYEYEHVRTYTLI
mmetsp:Transcript_3420/g.4314  ORF Transcript_3420/g.4314 Transcript_3420/m.4314 type:complete len:136 (+) Transcript_3420:187-594(+)